MSFSSRPGDPRPRRVCILSSSEAAVFDGKRMGAVMVSNTVMPSGTVSPRVACRRSMSLVATLSNLKRGLAALPWPVPRRLRVRDVNSNPFPSDHDIGVGGITTLFPRCREPSGDGFDGGSLLLLQIPHASLPLAAYPSLRQEAEPRLSGNRRCRSLDAILSCHSLHGAIALPRNRPLYKILLPRPAFRGNNHDCVLWNTKKNTATLKQPNA